MEIVQLPTPQQRMIVNFSFDKYNLSSWGSWHHLVLTHSKQKLDLYVDGQHIQTCLKHILSKKKEEII